LVQAERQEQVVVRVVMEATLGLTEHQRAQHRFGRKVEKAV
jgi:hypothetical protein